MLHPPLHTKNCYHPLFVMLYVLKLLPLEVAVQIPKSTRQDWDNRNYEGAYGFEHCGLYIKQFNDVSYAHRFTFTRYVLTTAIGIQKTFLEVLI